MKGVVTKIPLAPEPHGDYLAAMAFLAALAYPTSIPARDKFIRAGKAYIVKLAVKLKRMDQSKALPEFRRYPERRIWETGPIRNAAARIARRRLPAAATAVGMMMADTSRSTWLKVELRYKQIRIDGVNAAAGAFSKLKFGLRDTNWIERAWSESRPVLHLAIALQSHLDNEVAEGRTTDIYALIRYPQWVREALRKAESLRTLYLPAFSSIGFDPTTALALQPAE